MDRSFTGEVDWAGERRLFLGSTLGRHGCLVAPELKEWVATEVAKTTVVLKERRKAREERLLAGHGPSGSSQEPAVDGSPAPAKGRGGRGGRRHG